MTAKPQGVLWVCTCCLFARESEGCADHKCDRTPWNLEPDTDITAGLMDSEHECCQPWDEESECECERITFSKASCDACGSKLAGTRHAYTWWE